MHLFGRSLFGGALATGLVTLAGVALCSASATGEAQVHYKGAGLAHCEADAFAVGLRSANALGSAASCGAVATGDATAYFAASGFAVADARVVGRVEASFFGAGVAYGDAYTEGALYRRVRMRYQPPAKAYALASGEVVSYVLAYGRPALARAKLIGTTYFVGRGVASASASASGDGQRLLGAKQFARADATVSGYCLFTAGVAGVGLATATAWADAAVTKAGVRHFELVGSAEARALVSLSHWVVYQPQIMRATASAYASAVQTRGFSGVGTATARATGYMDMRYTGEVGAPAYVHATVTADGIRHVVAAGLASAQAQCMARPAVAFNGAGSATAVSALEASTLHLLLTGQPPALANAEAFGAGQRIFSVWGHFAAATAQARGFNQINDLLRAPRNRTLAVALTPRLVVVRNENRFVGVGA